MINFNKYFKLNETTNSPCNVELKNIGLTDLQSKKHSPEELLEIYKTVRSKVSPECQFYAQTVINPPLTLKLGRSYIFQNDHPYVWDYDFIKDKKIISGTTLNNLQSFQNLYKITYQKMYRFLKYTGYDTRYSTYITGVTSKNNPIVFARKETAGIQSGQTLVYTKNGVYRYADFDESLLIKRALRRILNKGSFDENDVLAGMEVYELEGLITGPRLTLDTVPDKYKNEIMQYISDI